MTRKYEIRPMTTGACRRSAAAMSVPLEEPPQHQGIRQQTLATEVIDLCRSRIRAVGDDEPEQHGQRDADRECRGVELDDSGGDERRIHEEVEKRRDRQERDHGVHRAPSVGAQDLSHRVAPLGPAVGASRRHRTRPWRRRQEARRPSPSGTASVRNRPCVKAGRPASPFRQAALDSGRFRVVDAVVNEGRRGHVPHLSAGSLRICFFHGSRPRPRRATQRRECGGPCRRRRLSAGRPRSTGHAL